MLQITHGERRALQMLAEGAASGAIAGLLDTTARDVEACLAGLFSRMGAADRAEALTVALRRGLLAPGTKPADRHACQERRSYLADRGSA